MESDLSHATNLNLTVPLGEKSTKSDRKQLQRVKSFLSECVYKML